jgi:hypothetical protein
MWTYLRIFFVSALLYGAIQGNAGETPGPHERVFLRLLLYGGVVGLAVMAFLGKLRPGARAAGARPAGEKESQLSAGKAEGSG